MTPTQADIQAAEKFYGRPVSYSNGLVQALAQHRLTAINDTLEKLTTLERIARTADDPIFIADLIETLIRNLKDGA